MKAPLLTCVLLCVVKVQAQTVEIALAPEQASDLFSARKHELALVAYLAPREKREFPVSLFQIAGSLAAPVPRGHQPPLIVEPADAIKRTARLWIELPKVERKTQFLLSLAGASGLRLTAYPDDLLWPIRELATQEMKLFTLTSAAALAGFLQGEKIPTLDLGASIPPEFSERAIILARKEPGSPQPPPSHLRDGQALVVFHSLEPNELPRVIAVSLGRGIFVSVKMDLLDRLSTSPRAQELFVEILDLTRTQLTSAPQTP
jgi:hypothetical protein